MELHQHATPTCSHDSWNENFYPAIIDNFGLRLYKGIQFKNHGDAVDQARQDIRENRIYRYK